jgi:hypothetical protein
LTIENSGFFPLFWYGQKSVISHREYFAACIFEKEAQGTTANVSVLGNQNDSDFNKFPYPPSLLFERVGD